MRSRTRSWRPGSRPGRVSGRTGSRSWTGRGCWRTCWPSGVIARALREAPTGHRYDRVLTAKMTVDLRPGRVPVPRRRLRQRAGDGVRAARPAVSSRARGPRPAAAFSQARKLLGEQAMKRIFELDAAVARRGPRDRAAVEGPGGHRHRRHHDGARAERRAGRRVRHPRGRRETAAADHRARPHRDLPLDQRRDRRLPRRRERPGRPAGRSFGPGMLNLADRGFFSMDRFLRFSATGADLAWRIKNGAKSVPLKTIRTLPDGSELVMLHESDGMRTRRRRETGDPHAERLPDTTARLVTFTILTETRSGRRKTTQVRVLTTLLDHEAVPRPRDRRPVCREMADRNRVPSPEEDRPRRRAAPCAASPRTSPARKPGHCCSSTTSPPPRPPAPPQPPASTPASSPSPPSSASSAPTSPPTLPAGTADTAPTSADDPLASLNAAILALPRHRPGRQRTSGRTATERRTRHTEEVTYTIEITKSNLPKWDTIPET